MNYRVISIGALSRHELWEEKTPTRTAHATTTLVESEGRVMLVDPALPAEALAARLGERRGIEPAAVTDVFLTSFRPAHRMGLAAFPRARWLISEREREAVGQGLVEQFERAEEEDVRKLLKDEIGLLKRFEPAPDRLAEHVDLFPLPGYTPGHCGLLLSETRATILVAGDAVATGEHLEQGRLLRDPWDLEQAKESLREAIEIADLIIPGHDNLRVNPVRM